MAVLMTALLVVLGTALVTMSVSETNVARNDEWSEGAFYAAEAGLEAAIDQLSGDPDASTQPIAVTGVAESYSFRSGGRADSTPQPLRYVGSQPGSGYTVNVGTGYNPSGYAFRVYEINATGTGPRNAQREIEAQVEVGPVAQ
jgi:hypothetical protein